MLDTKMIEDKRDHSYIFHEATVSICPYCLKTVQAKIVIKDSSVYILKNCKTHGAQLELLEEDAEYFSTKDQFNKPGTICKTQTEINKGCPFDCGICPSHNQHACIALIEITDHCDLFCNVCYADTHNKGFLDLNRIEKMMDFYQDSEFNNAEILQISGGEPTTHPDIIKVLKMAKSKKFKYVMLNTNGLKIANDANFAKELRQFIGGFEIYLQFDGLDPETHMHFRGKDLNEIKKKAIDNLAEYEIPITLVSTIENGVNDHEIGEIIEFGINKKYVRGINFQPVAFFGKSKRNIPEKRITLSGILNKIEKQTNGMLKKNDFIPLPCYVEKIAITYLHRNEKGFIPITRGIKIKDYLSIINNTFIFTIEDILKEAKTNIFNRNICDCFKFIKEFKKIIPNGFDAKSKKEKIAYVNENTFRISISSFTDVYNFDIKSMQKECTHIITPDLKKIPFSAYNMFYRKNNGFNK